MKKFLVLSLLVMMFASVQSASARGFYFYSTGAAAQSIITLDEPIEGYTDFGIVFDQFGILGIPLWNYGSEPIYAVYSDDGRVIRSAQLSSEEAIEFAAENGIEIDAEPTLSFWNRIGGKLILIPVILAALWVSLRGKGDEEESKAE